MAKVKNASASGVGWSAWFYITAQNCVIVEQRMLHMREMLGRLHNPQLLFEGVVCGSKQCCIASLLLCVWYGYRRKVGHPVK